MKLLCVFLMLAGVGCNSGTQDQFNSSIARHVVPPALLEVSWGRGWWWSGWILGFLCAWFLMLLSFVGVVNLPNDFEKTGRKEAVAHILFIIGSFLGALWFIHILVLGVPS